MDTVSFNPDGAELAGDLAGFSGATVPINEGYGINEAFFETRVPLAHDLPGVQDLTVDTGYRYSDYNTTGTTNTYKFEVQYAPIQDARLRFSFDRAVPRAESDRVVRCTFVRPGKCRGRGSLRGRHTHGVEAVVL